MLNNYTDLSIGWLMGQAGALLVAAWMMQIDNPNITLKQAINDIVVKKPAQWLLGILTLFIAIYLMPDTVNSLMEAYKQGVEMPDWQVFIVKWFKLSSLAFGATCQTIATFALSKLNRILKIIFEQP